MEVERRDWTGLDGAGRVLHSLQDALSILSASSIGVGPVPLCCPLCFVSGGLCGGCWPDFMQKRVLTAPYPWRRVWYSVVVLLRSNTLCLRRESIIIPPGVGGAPAMIGGVTVILIPNLTSDQQMSHILEEIITGSLAWSGQGFCMNRTR